MCDKVQEGLEARRSHQLGLPKHVDCFRTTFAWSQTNLTLYVPHCSCPLPSLHLTNQEWHDKGFRLHWDPVRRRFTILNVSRRSFVLRGGNSSLATGEKLFFFYSVARQI